MLQRVNPKQTADNLEAMARMAKERGAAVVLIGVPDRRLFGGVADYYAEIAAALYLPYEGEVMNEVLRDPALKSDPVHANSAGLPPDWRAPGGVVEGRRCGLARQPNRHR
jgi:acyl-CoA thioesterase-1